MPLPADPDLRPYGRRTFLGVVALGLSSLVWGESAWRALSSVLNPIAALLPGLRTTRVSTPIATVHSMT